MLDELVEDIQFISLIAKGHDVIANQILTEKAKVGRFPVQRISLTGVIGAEIDHIVATVDADLMISHIFGANGNLRVEHLIGVVENVRRERIAPL